MTLNFQDFWMLHPKLDPTNLLQVLGKNTWKLHLEHNSGNFPLDQKFSLV